MTELAKDVTAIDVTDLLTQYSFDLNGATLDRMVAAWLNRYPTQWVRLAVVEALYQGRYKAISVEQILNLWQRRGRALHRFNHEFERVVCGRFPSHYISPSAHAAAVRSPRKPSPPPAAKPTQTGSPQESVTPAPVLPKVEPPIAEPEAAPPTDSGAASSDYSEPDYSSPEAVDSSEAALQSPVPVFPSGDFEPEPLVALSASRSITRQPIHQFVPASEASDFYAKLRAVAQDKNGG